LLPLYFSLVNPSIFLAAHRQGAFAKLYLECRDTLGIDHADTLDALKGLADVVDAQVTHTEACWSRK